MKICIASLSVLLTVSIVAQSPASNYQKILGLENKVSKLLESLNGKPTRYVGCYKDDVQRLMKDSWVENESMTHNWCINYCKERHHEYAGLQYYNHCFCGNQLNCAKYPQMPEKDCNTPCKGNKNQHCGGVWRMSIFKLK